MVGYVPVVMFGPWSTCGTDVNQARIMWWFAHTHPDAVVVSRDNLARTRDGGCAIRVGGTVWIDSEDWRSRGEGRRRGDRGSERLEGRGQYKSADVGEGTHEAQQECLGSSQQHLLPTLSAQAWGGSQHRDSETGRLKRAIGVTALIWLAVSSSSATSCETGRKASVYGLRR